MQELVNNLNHPSRETRLESLRELMKMVEDGKTPKPDMGNDVNNHIHTTYSFSPYSLPRQYGWLIWQV